jgi:release factor glutamine methyltransferase
LSSSITADLVARLRAAGCVFAEDEAALLLEAAPDPAALKAMVERRVAGLPLEQVLGWAEFCGRRIVVEPGVFVPRRRTEFLAQHALDLARACRNGGRRPVVLDLCCGTGALGAVLAAELGREVAVFASDVEAAAVACARRNLPPDRVFHGDLYQALPSQLRSRVDVLVANAPYVPTGELGLMPREAREYEPNVALDGGDDGLAVVRRVVDEAGRWLAPGGSVLVETSHDQVTAALEAFARAGLTPRVLSSEELGATIVIGR